VIDLHAVRGVLLNFPPPYVPRQIAISHSRYSMSDLVTPVDASFPCNGSNAGATVSSDDALDLWVMVAVRPIAFVAGDAL
jgi:hypothetical protein